MIIEATKTYQIFARLQDKIFRHWAYCSSSYFQFVWVSSSCFKLISLQAMASEMAISTKFLCRYINRGQRITRIITAQMSPCFYLSFYEVQFDLTGILTRKRVSESSFSPLNVRTQASLGLSLGCVFLTSNANKSAYWVQNSEHWNISLFFLFLFLDIIPF